MDQKRTIPEARRRMIGERLRDFRESKGLTQEKMAEILEISKTHYSQAERGASTLGEYRMLKLYDELGADIGYILTGKASTMLNVSDVIMNCPPEKVQYVEQILGSISKLL